MTVSSKTNPVIKDTLRLRMAKYRRAEGLHFAESDKLVKEILSSGCAVERLFAEEGFPLPAGCEDIDTVTVTREIMEYLCESETPQHLCAVVRTPATEPPARYPDGLTVALDTLQDTGNLGTVIRTADALGASGILLGSGCADPFGAKALRAAMGSTYHVPLWRGRLEDELPRMKKEGFCCVCGHLKGSETLPPIGAKTVLVIGNEGNGVSDAVAAHCELYRLPMRGRAESLNAAIAAAILMYEISGRIPQA